MGKNNRQRRRHKQQRQRRTPTAPRGGPRAFASPGDPRFLAEGFALLAESIAAGALDASSDEILAALAAEWDTGTAAAASTTLHAVVAGAWEHGWQPADLVHAFGRKLPAVDRRLLVAVVLADAPAWRAHPHADPDWIAQVDDLAGDAPNPVLGLEGVVGGWRSGERLEPIDALLRAATLLGVLWTMPALPPLGDPPSRWGEAPTRSRRATPTGAPSGVDERMLARVRALLAKAESTEFAPEAESLTAKAQELAARHAIDQALLSVSGAGGGGGDERPRARRILVHDPYAKGKSHLLAQVAAANRCEAVWAKELGFSTVFGFATDLAVTDVLYTSLVHQCSTAMRAASRDVAGARSFRESFVVSFAVHIGDRLAAATSSTIEEASVAHGDALLPVLASREAKVEEARDEAFPRLRRVSMRASDHRGWVAGQAAAELADVQVGRAVHAGD